MIRLADVNVAFPILYQNHFHHQIAWEWWKEREDASVGYCLLTKLGVLRLLTNSTVMKGMPLETDETLDAWEQFTRDPRTVEVEYTGQVHELLVKELTRNRKPTPNLWTDAWLAALARSSRITLTTFDRGFQSYGLESLELLG
jgi:toxin-antitoxin system PIN domain toxin